MRAAVRFGLGVGVAALLVVWPFVHFRAQYAHHKRLREVAPGVLVRSGQLTAEGFRDAVRRFGVHTVVNCQNEDGRNEFSDPQLPHTFWDSRPVRESDLCRELGVRYVHLDPDLASNRTDSSARPAVIDEFLAVLDDPAARPVLLHCKAGLHRTGVLTAVYRMEYEGWGPRAALAELKAHGFGDMAGTAANDYVQQYVLNYLPRPKAHPSQRGGLGGHPTLP
jgi:hypothetical protein